MSVSKAGTGLKLGSPQELRSKVKILWAEKEKRIY